MVNKIINNDICVALQGHFKRHAHNKTTRNSNNSVSLPKINTEYSRQGFFYMGAKLYNKLSTSIRTAENSKEFIEKLDFFLKLNNMELKIGFLIFSSILPIYILVLKL